MKLLLPFLVSFTVAFTTQAQMNTTPELLALYEKHKYDGITSRRFTQAQMLHWIDSIRSGDVVSVENVGSSAEGRTIRLYALGAGKTTVLMWSQMHGDESTATMALMDLLKFFSEASDHPVAQTILQNLRLLMIPMINPDGAERFQRRTAQMIDMNRDALRLATPEARVLKKVRDRYNPDFGFNLHDQDPRYSVGQSTNPAAIALLAPAFDESKSDNNVRLRAKQIAAQIAETLGQMVPGHVTRYDDTFEPRAFGDNIQKWGTSTVLIESGGWPDDRNKMMLRKANVVALLSAFLSMSSRDYRQKDVILYEELPLNGKNRYDLILRGATFKASSSVPELLVDIGVNVEEQFDSLGQLVDVATIVDIGDLSTLGAFQEIDCSRMAFDSTEIELEKELPKRELDELLMRKRQH